MGTDAVPERPILSRAAFESGLTLLSPPPPTRLWKRTDIQLGRNACNAAFPECVSANGPVAFWSCCFFSPQFAVSTTQRHKALTILPVPSGRPACVPASPRSDAPDSNRQERSPAASELLIGIRCVAAGRAGKTGGTAALQTWSWTSLS